MLFRNTHILMVIEKIGADRLTSFREKTTRTYKISDHTQWLSNLYSELKPEQDYAQNMRIKELEYSYVQWFCLRTH